MVESSHLPNAAKVVKAEPNSSEAAGIHESAFVFRPIDLENHGALCASIRAETFAVSFDSDAMFWDEAGADGSFYLAALRERMVWNPQSCVHLWHKDSIVGMLELKPYGADSSVGYINTYYLAPEGRGQGWTDLLNEHIRTFFHNLDITTVRLTVSPNNKRAVRHYHRSGWTQIGELSVSAGWLKHYNAAVPDASPALATALDGTNAAPSFPEGESVYLMERRYER